MDTAPTGRETMVVDLGHNRKVRFATQEEGRALLGAQDEFIRRLGAFERAVRMGRDGEVTEADFLAFVSGCARAWPGEDSARVREALARASGKLSRYSPLLPEEIWLVHTSGEEEAGSGYTRGASIMLPPGKTRYSVERLTRFLVHECFHLLTRFNPRLRDQLYALLGFQPCGAVVLPERYERWRITNPDAPHQEHALPLAAGEGLFPVLHWKEPRFLPGRYFEHVALSLLPLRKHPAGGWEIAGEPRPKEAVVARFEALGMPFDQPEEMLAECFVQLVLEEAPAPPSLMKDMERVMTA